jgi:glycosyltransferase involved in cell wall biosynthesis
MSPPSLRVALVAPLWFPIAADRGGVEQVVFLLARELVAQGHDVTLVASGDSAPVGRLAAVCPEGLVAAMEKGRAFEYEYYEAAAIADALRLARAVDVVHSHLDFAFVPFADFTAAPVLSTIHRVVAADMAWAARRVPHAALATLNLVQAAALRGAGATDVVTVPNGIEIETFPFAQAPDDYLLFLGRVIPGKGPDIALDVAQELGQPLVLAGPALDARFLEASIRPAVDGDRVRYLGPVGGERKVELLRKARVLLFPSLLEEACPVVVLEAMACGTPVVALRRGAVPEIVTPGLNGFYGETREELPALVARAATLDRGRVRESVRERFSHRRMVADYVALYRRLVEGPRAGISRA